MVNVVASYADAAWPGIREWFGMVYNRYPEIWSQIFDRYTSDKNFERDVLHAGMGLFRVKPETAPISYDDMSQVRRIDYQHLTYALGFVMSREAIEDNLYKELQSQRTEELATKARLTEEILCASWFAKVFSSTMLQSDGKTVCATDHPLARVGSVGTNRPANAVDFSEAALESALIDIQLMPDETGNIAQIMGMKLIGPAHLQYDFERVLGNKTAQPDTAERNINGLVNRGALPDGYLINPYFDANDQDAWFIKTNCSNGLKHYTRRALEFSNDTQDFDTENAKFKCTFRNSRGISNWRALWGSPGA